MNIHRDTLVSIVVCTYNSAKYVCEALQSTKEQTYPWLELVISDDASQDDTVEICGQWLEVNKSRFVRTAMLAVPKNTGIPANANRGIHKAEGEWIKLLAGDDCLLPKAIEQYMDYVWSRANVDVVFSSINKYYANFKAKSFINKYPRKFQERLFADHVTAKDQYREILLNGLGGYAPSFFVSKKALINVGGFDERFKFVEDYPMWCKLTKYGYKLFYNDVVTVNYRRHENSIDTNYSSEIKSVSFLINEAMRNEYVYPYLSKFYYYKKKFPIMVYRILSSMGMNKNKMLNIKMYAYISKYSNIFNVVEFITDRILRLKIKKTNIE